MGISLSLTQTVVLELIYLTFPPSKKGTVLDNNINDPSAEILTPIRHKNCVNKANEK